jgi:hypothetical protein
MNAANMDLLRKVNGHEENESWGQAFDSSILRFAGACKLYLIANQLALLNGQSRDNKIATCPWN